MHLSIEQKDLRKLCLYRSLHRGCKELDIIMEGYIKSRLDNFSEGDLLLYSKLLEMEDSVIYDYILGTTQVPFEHNNKVMQDFIEFARFFKCV